MNQSLDRLYELLPAVYRQRDVEHGDVLRALLQIIAEQVNVVEDDIGQLYDNWFIETCQDWVVPYIGDLIGYSPAYVRGKPDDVATADDRRRNAILAPRRDVANTIGARRRRGTLAILAQQALDVAGWPARAVEFFTLLSFAQSLPHLGTARGRLTDLRNGDALDRLGGPFEAAAHTVDTRRLSVRGSSGRYNLPSVGLFVWRLRSNSVTMRPPYCQESIGPQCYNFSALGNDLPLYNRVEAPAPGAAITDEREVPAPIRRRVFEQCLREYYGDGKSVLISWIPPGASDISQRVPIPIEQIIVADLSEWRYRTPRGKVAIDPELGRIAFPASPSELPRRGVWVSYNYGFPDDLGGGEYPRDLGQSSLETRMYSVGEDAPFRRVVQALEQWRNDRPQRAIIEITDSAVYPEQLDVELAEDQSLELRAANGSAPVLRLLDWRTEQPDSLTVNGMAGSCFTLDGILITGRGVQVSGDLVRLTLRHCTLVPGWSLQPDCEPRRPAEPSLELTNIDARVTIDRCIIGSIQVRHDEVLRDPIRIAIADSVLDATGAEREALGAPDFPFAHAVLDIRRSTVIGQVQIHAIELAENSIFDGEVRVARRQLGCMRFCFVPPGSRTPRRYNCQPDLALRPIEDEFARGEIDAAQRSTARDREVLRVKPEYNSTRYGTPTYCQLSATCAGEIRSGADDESEMGVYHDLFQPQRAANLCMRLSDFTPAGTDSALIFVS
jgi:hypothetical protein